MILLYSSSLQTSVTQGQGSSWITRWTNLLRKVNGKIFLKNIYLQHQTPKLLVRPTESTDSVDCLLPRQELCDHLLKHCVITFTYWPNNKLYSGIFINFLNIKPLSGPPCEEHKTQLPYTLTSWSNVYVFLLQI